MKLPFLRKPPASDLSAQPAENIAEHVPSTYDGSNKERGPTPAQEVSTGQDQSKVLTGKKLALAFTAMLLTLFLVAIDQTILSPALPVITDQFDAYSQAAWIVSSFILTQACFLLCYGQILLIFKRKYVYMSAVIIFEIGSLLCGVAPEVNTLIFGRALAGVGASGIFVSMIALVADISRIEDRPLLMGLFGMVFGVSSIVGPLMGGAFSQHVTWQWCFFINLPIGAVALVAIWFLLPKMENTPITPAISETASRRYRLLSFGGEVKEGSLMHRLCIFDLGGAVLLLAAIVFLLLAVVSGGIQYPWNSGYVIGFFVAAGVTSLLFFLFEYYLAGASPLLPLRFFKNKTVVGAAIIGFCQFWAMFIYIYFLSQSFEAVFNDSPTNAGLKSLPFMASFIVTSIVAGILVKKIGRYFPFMATSPAFLSIGGGLMYTLDSSSSYAKYAGFSVIVGLGIGPVFQNVFLAVQAAVLPREIPQATACVTLFQRLGGAVGYAASQSIVNTQFKANLARLAPEANYDRLSKSIVDIWNESVTPPSIRPAVVQSFTEAIRYGYVIGVPLGGVCLLAAVILIKDINIKVVGAQQRQQGSADASARQSHDLEKAPSHDEKTPESAGKTEV